MGRQSATQRYLDKPFDHLCHVLTSSSGPFHVRCFERVAATESLPFIMLMVPSEGTSRKGASRPDRGATEILRVWKQDQLQQIAVKEHDLKRRLVFRWAVSHHRTSAKSEPDMSGPEYDVIYAQIKESLVSKHVDPDTSLRLIAFVLAQPTYLDFLRQCEVREELMNNAPYTDKHFENGHLPVEWWNPRNIFFARAECQAETTHKLSTALSL